MKPPRPVVTLVTGASSGIGWELARLAAPDSRVLVVVARRTERLRELAELLEREAPDCQVLVRPVDLTVRAERRQLTEEFDADPQLAVDHLVNNAGFGLVGPLLGNDPDTERAMVELDVAAVHDLTVSLLPGMVERGYGRVMNVASTAGYQPLPGFATYAATKAFVQSFSEALWQELRGTGVAVTTLSPGVTATEFGDRAGMPEGALEGQGMTARAVAEAGYAGMVEGKRVVVPGFSNRLSSSIARRLPRRPVMAIAQRVMGRFANEDGNSEGD